MVRKREQSRLKELLCEAITVLCKASLSYRSEFNIEGLVGITVDNEEIFLINLNEHIRKPGATNTVGGPASSHHSLSPAFNTSVKSEPDARSNSPPENCVSNVIPKYVPPKRRRLAGPERTSGVKEEWSEGSAPCSPQAVTPPATPNTRPSVEDAGGGGSGGGGGSNSNSSGDISRRGDENMRSDKEREEETPPATPGCSTWPNLAAITANHLRGSTGDSPLPGLDGVTVKSEVPDDDLMRQQALESFLAPGDGAALCGPLRGLPWPVMPPELVSGVHAGTLQQLHSLTLSGHYCTQIPARGRLGRPRKRCRVCWALGQRRETRYCCAGCHSLPGLCPQPCFIMFHMEKHLLPADDATPLSLLPLEESNSRSLADATGEGWGFLADPDMLQQSHTSMDTSETTSEESSQTPAKQTNNTARSRKTPGKHNSPGDAPSPGTSSSKISQSSKSNGKPAASIDGTPPSQQDDDKLNESRDRGPALEPGNGGSEPSLTSTPANHNQDSHRTWASPTGLTSSTSRDSPQIVSCLQRQPYLAGTGEVTKVKDTSSQSAVSPGGPGGSASGSQQSGGP